MTICPGCSSAIRRLRPQDLPSEREDPEVTIEVPVLDPAGVNSCWICFKFSRWLEAEAPKYLDEWRRRSLLVKFTAIGRIYREDPQSDTLLHLSINMSPLSLEEDDAACAIELSFTMATGTVVFLNNRNLYIMSKLTACRVFHLYIHRLRIPPNREQQPQNRRRLDWKVLKRSHEMREK